MVRNSGARTGLSRRAALGAGLATVLSPAFSPRSLAQDLIGDLRGALDATEHGLVSGAADDQGAALARALAAAESDGRPLFLPPGRYEVAEVELPAHAHLIGVPGRTRLVFAGGGFMLRARHATLLRLEGMALDGEGAPATGDASALLEAEDVDDLVIDDCDFSGSAGALTALRGCAGRVERSRFRGGRTVGIDLMQSRGMAVLDNVVSECGDTGIFVGRDEEGADDTIVRGNRVSAIGAKSGGTGQYGNGINLAKANGVIVTDNRIDDCAFSAIRCFSSDNLQVAGNIVTRSGEVAIYIEFAFEGAVVSDNLIDEAGYGISFANFMTYGGRLSACTGNIVRNISGVSRLPRGDDPLSGAGIGAEADTAITANLIENARRGIELGYGPYLRDCSATGNVIRRCPIGIAATVAEGAGPALIADNLVSGSETGAIIGMRWEEVATGDLAEAGAEAFPHLTIAGNRID